MVEEEEKWELRARLEEVEEGIPGSLRQMIEKQVEGLYVKKLIKQSTRSGSTCLIKGGAMAELPAVVYSGQVGTCGRGGERFRHVRR